MNVLTTFRRFAIIGPNQPSTPDLGLLGKLEANRLQISELGTPEPVEYGWSGGRHLEDGEFTFASNVFNDCLVFALRIDTNKVPGDIKKSYQLQEEQAAAKGNPSGFITKKQKLQAKDAVAKRIEGELRTGKHRRSKLIPILWDLPHQTVYTPAGLSVYEYLGELFERTFGLHLGLVTAGSLALRHLEPLGARRQYEDLKPTRFVSGPGGESQWPDYPWVMKGPEPKDFLGNEFLLWLWWHADAGTGVIKTGCDDTATIMFDKSIDMDCAYGETGRDTFRGIGVSRMPEALHALKAGKLPRKAGLILDAHGSQYTFTIAAELMAISGLAMPEVEKADTPRTLLEERITQLREFAKSIDELYQAFLQERCTATWNERAVQIRKWIQK